MDNLLDYYLRHTDRSFAAGVDLLHRHAPTAVTGKIMQRFHAIVATRAQPGEYELGKLRAALRDTLIPPHDDPADPAPDRPPSAPERMVLAGTPISDRAKRLHKEHAHYHALLLTATTDAARADHAHIIMSDIIPALDAYYDNLRAGSPDTPITDDFDPIPITGGALGGVDTIRRLNSLRTRVSKITRQLLPAAPTVARRAELEKELEQKRAEIARIEADIA
jgi:hypothetical protein